MEIDGGDLLPEDLLIDILSSLPVKSLLRFKCVCKSWRSFIENPSFITKHLNNDDRECFLFFTRFDRPRKKYLFSLLSYETPSVIEDLRFPYNLTSCKGADSAINILGCCNGIICVILYGKAIGLWNPATREVKTLPRYSITRGTSGAFGFGFDAKSNDYKVVHLYLYKVDSWRKSNGYKVEVYNLSVNSWRKIDPILPRISIHTSELGSLVPYVNGKFSWYAVDKCTQRDIILSFDMSQEEFVTTPLPDVNIAVNEPRCLVRQLMVVHESIALIIYARGGANNGNYEVWVLNEYGVKESWTKLYTFGPHIYSMSPSGFWKNTYLFVEHHEICSTLALFNMVTQEIKNIHYGRSFFHVILYYKESLIPLKGYSCFNSRVPHLLS